MRLNKYIAASGFCSRRKADQYISEGRVSINGVVTTALATQVDAASDVVAVDGKTLQLQSENVTLLLNKPAKVLSTVTDDRGRKTVMDLISIPKTNLRLYPVGRLDYDTEGLLLLSNDGELTHAMTHPKLGIRKRYLVHIDRALGASKLQQLRSGVDIGDYVTRPCRAKERKEGGRSLVEMEISEGKNRQVRRMLETLGRRVLHLERIAYAFLDLSGVPRGSYRRLRSDEVQRLKRLTK